MMTDTHGKPPRYEAPRIEQVLTAEQLNREVHYAGFTSPPPA